MHSVSKTLCFLTIVKPIVATQVTVSSIIYHFDTTSFSNLHILLLSTTFKFASEKIYVVTKS